MMTEVPDVFHKAFPPISHDVPPGAAMGMLHTLVKEPEQDTNDEFSFGTFTLGFIAGQTVKSGGWGLGLSVDIDDPEPGFHLVIGLTSIWWRRNWPFVVSFLNYTLISWGARAETP